jgi:hypothetical protein
MLGATRTLNPYEEVVAIWIIVNEVTLGASGFSLRVMN